jgi:hypothetical protein
MSLTHRPIAAQRERNVRIHEYAERVAQTQPSWSQDGPAPVIIVPANTRACEPLPPPSRAVFLAGLSILLKSAYAAEDAADAEGDAVSLPLGETGITVAPADDVLSTLGHACATCRGQCCTAGGNHAFLRGENLTRLRNEHPDDTAESLLAQYAAHLPEQHYRDSCVYHTTSGCALPRTLRSDLCNRYLCGGLTQLKRTLAISGGATAYIGAADTGQLLRLAVVTPGSAVTVPLMEL